MKIAIVTGVSKGLGASVAELFLNTDITLFGVSRTENDKLKQIADETNTIYEHFKSDLTQEKDLECLIHGIGDRLAYYQPSHIYLVNNAAMVNPVHQASELVNEELSQHIHLNMTAPMILINSILQHSNNLGATLVGLTVTSGAAENPIYGWSAYCSTKAAVNMFTKTVALEQHELKTGHKLVAFNPGIMDTNMQQDIRKHSYEEFLDIDRFKSYKDNELLRDPQEIANVLYKIIINPEKIQNGSIYNVADYL